MSRRQKRVYQFVDEIPENLLCVHCHGVLRNGVKLNECEHAVCEVCLQKRIKNDLLHCPCSMLLKEAPLEESIKVRQDVNNLVVYCSKNCGAKVEIEKLDSHIQNECLMKKLLCTNNGCTAKINRGDLERHEAVCDFRIVCCKGCSKSLKYADLRRHQLAQGCMSSKLKQTIVKQLRDGEKELKKHIVQVKQDTYKTMRDERNLQKEYMWRRIERNPGNYSATLVRYTDLERKAVSSNGNGKRIMSVVSESMQHFRRRRRRANSIECNTCNRCGKQYFQHLNHEAACTWHSGPIVNVFGGMCQSCGRLDNLEGCLKGIHISS